MGLSRGNSCFCTCITIIIIIGMVSMVTGVVVAIHLCCFGNACITSYVGLQLRCC